MKANIGTIDKVFRTIIAGLFIVLYFTHTIEGVPGIILLLLAGVFLITGFISRCPLYTPLGINTIKTEKIRKP